MLYTLQNFFFSLTIIMLSWTFGAILNLYLKRKQLYNRFQNVIFIKKDSPNRILGVNFFKLIVTKTVYGKINKLIKINNRDQNHLLKMREEMVNSEVGHAIGFLLAQIAYLLISYSYEKYTLLIVGSFLNIILNLYPILLQQKNKKRIDQFLLKFT